MARGGEKLEPSPSLGTQLVQDLVHRLEQVGRRHHSAQLPAVGNRQAVDAVEDDELDRVGVAPCLIDATAMSMRSTHDGA
jgi:hypothetical protein